MNGDIKSGDVFSKFKRTVVALVKGKEDWQCARWDGSAYDESIQVPERVLYSDYTFEGNIFELSSDNS